MIDFEFCFFARNIYEKTIPELRKKCFNMLKGDNFNDLFNFRIFDPSVSEMILMGSNENRWSKQKLVNNSNEEW